MGGLNAHTQKNKISYLLSKLIGRVPMAYVQMIIQQLIFATKSNEISLHVFFLTWNSSFLICFNKKQLFSHFLLIFSLHFWDLLQVFQVIHQSFSYF